MSRTDVTPDPTRVRDQPQLRRPAPALWLLCAGLVGAIAVALFALNMPVSPAVARLGILLEGALFVAMVAVTIARPPRRRQGIWYAVLMTAMALVAVVLLSTLAALAAAPA